MRGRDLEVLTLLTWGRTNRQVADELGVSLSTAQAYIRLAYRKVGVTRRTQAVVWGFRNGLATTDWARSTGAEGAVPALDKVRLARNPA